jgi:hypothetical protein
MSPRAKWARYTDVARQWKQIETEYAVDIEVTYFNRGDTARGYRVLALYTARPLPWSDLPQGRYVNSGEVVVNRGSVSVDSQHMYLLSGLMHTLQLFRWYPTLLDEHFLPD